MGTRQKTKILLATAAAVASMPQHSFAARQKAAGITSSANQMSEWKSSPVKRLQAPRYPGTAGELESDWRSGVSLF